MWELMPEKAKYAIPVFAGVLLYLLFNQCFGHSFFRTMSYVITATPFLAFIFGKYLWKYLYIDLLKEHLCPDFNGRWIAKIKSNFDGETLVEIPVEIEADFFSIKMKGETSFGRSWAPYCKVIKAEDGSYELEYMFRARNDSPLQGDTSFYEGAARLTVKDISSMHMKGVYWTNRCWQDGKNTAGQIELIKQV